jgi:hypothetical protein
LDRTRDVNQIDAAADGSWRRRKLLQDGLFPGPVPKNFFNGVAHFRRFKISDQQENGVFRSVEVAIERLQLLDGVCGNLLLSWRNQGVWMLVKKDFSQTFTGQKTRLGALKLYFFEFLATFAVEFWRGKRSFAGQFIDELKKRFGLVAEAGKGNGAGILAGADGKIGAEAAQALFDFATRAFGRAGANHGGGHLSERDSAIGGSGIAGAKEEFAVKLGNGVRFDEDKFEAVGELAFAAMRPTDFALRSQRRNSRCSAGGLRGHYAASLEVAAGARKTMARFAGLR